MAVDDSREGDGGTYDLSAVAPGVELPPGTNVLVGGPPVTAKREVGLRILAAGSNRGEGAIVVTTKDRAEAVIEAYTQLHGGDNDAPLGVVDCVSQQGEDASPRDDDRIRYARSPTDMTGIGTNFTELLDEFYHERGLDRNRVMLHSVSTLLMYFDLETVFRFLHVFTRRIETADALGVFLIDATAHDDQEMNTLLQLFDATLTVEESEPGSEPTLQFSARSERR